METQVCSPGPPANLVFIEFLHDFHKFPLIFLIFSRFIPTQNYHRDDPSLPLQKAGHASLVETSNGRWYLAYLCGRPLPGTRLCNLGRETSLVECQWTEDGWLRLVSGTNHPLLTVEDPGLPSYPFEPEPQRVEFHGPRLPNQFETRREPPDPSWCSLTARPGTLRLHGRESPGSRFDVSIVARRLTSQHATVSTLMWFEPCEEHHLAGLICFYDERNFFLLRVGHDEELGRFIGVFAVENGSARETNPALIAGKENQPVELRATFAACDLNFFWRTDEGVWRMIDETFNAGTLSDDACNGFTGTYVGMSVHDLTGGGLHADFKWFELAPMVKEPVSKP